VAVADFEVMTPLGDLRWHWGSAYIINCLGLGKWVAERRDTHETLRDETPLGLREQIIADYGRRRVPRTSSG
jgi:hypothetical protein